MCHPQQMDLSEPAPPTLVKQSVQTDIGIVSFGYELAGLLAGHPPVTIIAGAPDDESVVGIVETLTEALTRSRWLIVVAADWIEPPEDRRLRTALMILDSDRIGVSYRSLPPLAGGVLAVLAAALTEHLHAPGLTLGALDNVAAELLAVAWLRSISGLRRPTPSLAQHASSLVSGRGFVVGVTPHEFVHRAARDHETGLSALSGPMQLVFADRAGNRDWVTRVIAPALGGGRIGEVQSPSRAPEWWGTSRLTEAVAYPAHLEELAERVSRDLTLVTCGWCETSVVALPCPFCGHAG